MAVGPLGCCVCSPWKTAGKESKRGGKGESESEICTEGRVSFDGEAFTVLTTGTDDEKVVEESLGSDETGLTTGTRLGLCTLPAAPPASGPVLTTVDLDVSAPAASSRSRANASPKMSS